MLMHRVSALALVDRPACPLCQGADNEEFIRFPEIPVLRCRACGFKYSGKVLPHQDMLRMYAEQYGGELHLRGQMINAGINAMVLGRLIDPRAIRSVLDIGTGYGFLLRRLRRQYDVEVTGVELSRQEAQYASRHSGARIVNGLLGASGLAKDSHDLVSSFEVIEHTTDPLAFLHELTDYVKVGGFMVVMTDNFEGRMAKAMGAGFPKWIPHGHVSHFSAATLRQAIERTGRLQVVDARSYTPWELLLMHAYHRLRGVRRTAGNYDLTASLENERPGAFRLFRLRKLLNRAWARFTLSRNLDGDLIYFLCRRTS